MRIMQNSTGRLRVEVYDISVARPLGNVTVRVSQTEENGGELITELITNDSGQTDIIDLPAPPVDYSLSPDQPKPFSQYNVTANAEGFDEAFINGVQIFADTLAIQQIRLAPTVAPGEEQVIDIAYPRLWGDFPPKIPEDEVKELPPETGFVVLDRVVIPEYIIVHDGSPNDNTAPNYYIPYKDYIKNVASSEIYSTWDDAAIRANILAIISFTLNRVYTEWYRNRGKNFTITSSTDYV